MIRHAPDNALAWGLAASAPAALGQEELVRGSVLRQLARALRLHQCAKNVVVFVPLVLGGALTDLVSFSHTLLAFVALCCVASGTYLLNDIWDVGDDRNHWSKRERPIASGGLSAATALVVALVLIPAGIALGALVSLATCAALLLYLGLTLYYTLHLKTVPFVDGLALAALFTIRLGIGAVAAGVPPSAWLFVFSMFLFASLSYAKRYTEISRAIVRQSQSMNGRGYRPVDAPMVLTIGLSTGVGAVMIMVLYIVEEAFRSSFYGATGWLWGFPPLIFLFIIRIWLVSTRGEMMDDPVASPSGADDRPPRPAAGLLRHGLARLAGDEGGGHWRSPPSLIAHGSSPASIQAQMYCWAYDQEFPACEASEEEEDEAAGCRAAGRAPPARPQSVCVSAPKKCTPPRNSLCSQLPEGRRSQCARTVIQRPLLVRVRVACLSRIRASGRWLELVRLWGRAPSLFDWDRLHEASRRPC
jgi:4-hydroxybenzoate polyprenyltransferase